jgi:hypothetical protein
VCTNRHLSTKNEGTHQLVKASESENGFSSNTDLALLFTAFSRNEESSKQNVSKCPLQPLNSARLSRAGKELYSWNFIFVFQLEKKKLLFLNIFN